MAEAWYLRNSSLPLAVRLPIVTPKFEPRGYPPMNASGNTTSWDPYPAASANNLSALSVINNNHNTINIFFFFFLILKNKNYLNWMAAGKYLKWRACRRKWWRPAQRWREPLVRMSPHPCPLRRRVVRLMLLSPFLFLCFFFLSLRFSAYVVISHTNSRRRFRPAAARLLDFSLFLF